MALRGVDGRFLPGREGPPKKSGKRRKLDDFDPHELDSAMAEAAGIPLPDLKPPPLPPRPNGGRKNRYGFKIPGKKLPSIPAGADMKKLGAILGSDPMLVEMVAPAIAAAMGKKKRKKGVSTRRPGGLAYPPYTFDRYYYNKGPDEEQLEELAKYAPRTGFRRVTTNRAGDYKGKDIIAKDVANIRKRMRQMAHVYRDLTPRAEGMKVSKTKSVRERNYYEMRDLKDQLIEVGGLTPVNRRYYAMAQRYEDSLLSNPAGSRLRLNAPPANVGIGDLEAHDQADVARFQGKLPWKTSPFIKKRLTGYSYDVPRPDQYEAQLTKSGARLTVPGRKFVNFSAGGSATVSGRAYRKKGLGKTHPFYARMMAAKAAKAAGM